MLINFGGKDHNLVPQNAVVTLFTNEVWQYMEHIYHYCNPENCPVGSDTVVVSFDQDAIDFCVQSGVRRLVCDDMPTEDEFTYWDAYKAHNPIKGSDLIKFHQELEQGVKWKELDER